MVLRTNTNVESINAHRWLSTTTLNLNKSLERLSSAKRLNRASDDAAGLSIAETMRAQVKGAQQAARNIMDGVSLLQVADAALDHMTQSVQRMRELAVEASNGVYSDEQLANMDQEYQQLKADIQDAAANASFNGLSLFGGSSSGNVQEPRSSTTTSPFNNAVYNLPVQTNTANAVTLATNGAGDKVIPLSATPEQYNLGAANPSIDVSLIRTVPGPGLRTIPYSATNGYTYDPVTNSILLHGTAQPTAGETLAAVKFRPLGSLDQTLSAVPVPGAIATDVNGAGLAPGANGYTLSGTTVSLTGAARPSVNTPSTLTANYIPDGQTFLPLDTFNGSFAGATLVPGTLSFSIDGSPVALTAGVDYTLQQTPVDLAGQTTLYSYTVVFDNAKLATYGLSAHTIQADYTIDYPTVVTPLDLVLQVGADYGNIYDIPVQPVSVGTLGLAFSNVGFRLDAYDAINDCQGALDQLSQLRGRYAGDVNALEKQFNVVTSQATGNSAAESQIRDVDMAEEMSNLTRQQILQGAGVQSLKTAQLNPQLVLQLLKG